MTDQLVISYDSNNTFRYIVPIHILVNREVKDEQFIIDTGSKITSVYYSVVDPKLNEAMCIARMLETKVVTGILNSSEATIKYYKYPIDVLIFDDMHVPCSHIWITFNKDVRDSILGMDIIKKLYLVHVPTDNGQLILTTDRNIAINVLSR